MVSRFNRGEIWWYINPFVNKEDFGKDDKNQDVLDNRPVLIISDYVDSYNSSVIVVTTTTSPHRFGIEADLPNDKGKITTVNIMPGRMRQVPVRYLRDYIGRLDDSTMEQIYESIDFHFGRSTKVPEYVTKEQELRKLISEQKAEQQEQFTRFNNTYTIPYETLSDIRAKLNEKLDTRTIDPYGDIDMIDDLIFEAAGIEKRSIVSTKYNEYSDNIEDIFKITCMSNVDISKTYNIPLDYAEDFKSVIQHKLALCQIFILNKILTHNESIKDFDEDRKVMFISIDNESLCDVIKKGDVLINCMKSRFLQEISLFKDEEN